MSCFVFIAYPGYIKIIIFVTIHPAPQRQLTGPCPGSRDEKALAGDGEGIFHLPFQTMEMRLKNYGRLT